MNKHLQLLLCLVPSFLQLTTQAQNLQNNPQSNHGNKFEQLGTILPDANTYRTASGAPGHQYWQQRADYVIDAALDEENKRLEGSEKITFFNNSPDVLTYVWLQLDENEHRPENENNHFDGSRVFPPYTNGQLERLDKAKFLEGHGCNVLSVTDTMNKALKYTINYTMMRVDLPKPLKSKEKFTFKVKWNYKIPERMKIGGRGGYELFEDNGNSLFTITQWFPRMAVYSDYQGWNHKQFTGRGEFSLIFGNYKVNMKVPADHVVAATGVCTNLKEVLTPAQLIRWEQTQKAKEPVEVVTLEEAKAREKNPDKTNTKIWKFSAENVRDFAWGSSRKFVWDAMAIDQNGKKVNCMSFYPKESYGLYRKYSTKVVAHTIRTYSKYTISYPYPTAISVEASSGMEYPMICFNFGRTEADGTYGERTKYGMIGVIIHEVGHNFFPMIVNSDERNWSWMDEGLNTFCQFLAEQEFDLNYPSSRGPAHKIADYMRMPKDFLEPIMTNSENIINFGANAYGKPATALNILRETVMGRELFDYAFKEYARRWAFKHPAPADFFRTMEDASAVDLDWFWRGWFFDIDPVDISIDTVKAFAFEKGKEVPKPLEAKADRAARPATPKAQPFTTITQKRNKESGIKFAVETDTSLQDFYYVNRDTEANQPSRSQRTPQETTATLEDDEFKPYSNNFYYEVAFSNKGGNVMPIIVQWNFKDGTSEIDRMSAYIWRKDEKKVVKTFSKSKEVESIVLDPLKETADIDESNNVWPKTKEAMPVSRFDLFKAKRQNPGENEVKNAMQRAKETTK